MGILVRENIKPVVIGVRCWENPRKCWAEEEHPHPPPPRGNPMGLDTHRVPGGRKSVQNLEHPTRGQAGSCREHFWIIGCGKSAPRRTGQGTGPGAGKNRGEK